VAGNLDFAPSACCLSVYLAGWLAGCAVCHLRSHPNITSYAATVTVAVYACAQEMPEGQRAEPGREGGGEEGTDQPPQMVPLGSTCTPPTQPAALGAQAGALLADGSAQEELAAVRQQLLALQGLAGRTQVLEDMLASLVAGDAPGRQLRPHSPRSPLSSDEEEPAQSSAGDAAAAGSRKPARRPGRQGRHLVASAPLQRHTHSGLRGPTPRPPPCTAPTPPRPLRTPPSMRWPGHSSDPKTRPALGLAHFSRCHPSLAVAEGACRVSSNGAWGQWHAAVCDRDRDVMRHDSRHSSRFCATFKLWSPHRGHAPAVLVGVTRRGYDPCGSIGRATRSVHSWGYCCRTQRLRTGGQSLPWPDDASTGSAQPQPSKAATIGLCLALESGGGAELRLWRDGLAVGGAVQIPAPGWVGEAEYCWVVELGDPGETVQLDTSFT
jgi:hypothetical protein